MLKDLIVQKLKISKNVRNPKGRVLVSYIIHPFLPVPIKQRHTNIQEVRALVKELNGRGLSVDIVDCRYNRNIEFGRYDYLFGFGTPFENSFYSKSFRGKRICLATGSRFDFQTNATLQRLNEYRKLTGHLAANEARFVSQIWPMQWSFSDELLFMGSDTIKETFDPHFFGNNIRSLPVTYIYCIDGKAVAGNRNLSVGRKNVLWFGGKGLIHKGLDLAVGACRMIPEITLHVCGVNPDSNEYRKIIDYFENPPNIVCHGFVDVTGARFRELMNICGFAVMPSCSESQVSSIIQVMANGGLMPIVTKFCGLFPEHPFIEIVQLNEEGVYKSLRKAMGIENANLRNLWVNCANSSMELNSIDSYIKAVMRSFDGVDK